MAARLVSKGAAVDDAKKLTGPEKAAVVLLSLGEEHTALWQQLDDEEIKEVSQAMAGLGTVTAAVVEEVLVEFVSGIGGSGSLMGSYEQTQRLLASFMPGDRVEALMEEIRGPAGRTMWDKLGNVNEAVLANYLKNEYPQTVAVVLSKIKPDHASRVLTALPEDFALECVQRMLRMEPVQRDILDKMDFMPIMHGEPALMDSRIFQDEPMKIRSQMLEIPLAERLSYDAGKNLFFLNFEGLNVRSQDDIARIERAVDDCLQPVGHKVFAIVNYDRFAILPELVEDYIAMVKGVVERHYHEVTRYTSNTFLRVKLGEALEKGSIAPHLYETASEAEASLPVSEDS